MNADSAVNIGSTHSLCQDYVIARNPDRAPYVVLSDGCSSSNDTDIGARLLVRAMDQRLVANAATDMEGMHTESARIALGWAGGMGVAAGVGFVLGRGLPYRLNAGLLGIATRLAIAFAARELSARMSSRASGVVPDEGS